MALSTLAVGIANGHKMPSVKPGKTVSLGKGVAVGVRGGSPRVKVKFLATEPSQVVSTSAGRSV